MGPLSEDAQDRLEFTLWDAPRLGAGLEEDIRDVDRDDPQCAAGRH